jgi:hypothetical protein
VADSSSMADRVAAALGKVVGDRRVFAAATAAFGLGAAAIPHGSVARRRGKRKKKRSSASPCPPAVVRPLRSAFDCSTSPSEDYAVRSRVARYAQAFTPTRGGELRAIVLQVFPPASPGVGDFVMQLLRADGGVPSAAAADVLATVAVPYDDVSAGWAFLVASFPPGTRIDEGTSYAFALTTPTEPVGLRVPTGPSRCGTVGYVEEPEGTFVPLGDDAAFRFAVLVE